MTLKRFCKLISVISLAGAMAPAAFPQNLFTPRDLRGTFTFYFEGSLIRTATNVPLPVIAVGTITLDGEGKGKGTRYLNFAGQVVKETATGTYTVDSDGFGSITFIATPLPGEPPAVPATLETFYFVLKSREGGWGVSATIRAANGDDIGMVVVTRAEFVRREGQ